jgi:hypothetical protein
MLYRRYVRYVWRGGVVTHLCEGFCRQVLLWACYERGGFDDSPLSAGQSRFQTQDLERMWAQIERLDKLMPSEGSSVSSSFLPQCLPACLPACCLCILSSVLY